MTTNKDIVNSWIKKGDNDFRNAEIVIKSEDPPVDTICFHCQQAAEKYLKALLADRGKEPPKMHDLEKLILLLKDDFPQLAKYLDEAETLSDYAVEIRYPNFYEDIPLEDGRKAFAIITRLRQEIKKILA